MNCMFLLYICMFMFCFVMLALFVVVLRVLLHYSLPLAGALWALR